MSRKSFTPEQELDVIERFKRRETIYQIAAHYNVSVRPVCRVIDTAGLTSKQQETEARLTTELRAEIAKACKNGMKIEEAATHYRLGRRTVQKIVTAHGVSLPIGRPASWEHWMCERGKANEWFLLHGWRRVQVPGKFWRSGQPAFTYIREDEDADEYEEQTPSDPK